MNDSTQRHDAQWQRERDFFDKRAAEASDYDDAIVLERYKRYAGRGLYSKEYALRLAGSLTGKSVLDIGCGMGETSILLAGLGARVTGVDISEGSIDVAKSRARSARVAGSVKFEAIPFEIATDNGEKFDAVWCDAFFHHVIPQLGEVVEKIGGLMKPGALLVLSEPVRFSQFLVRIRRLIPPAPEATPDERPLTREELDQICKPFMVVGIKYTGPLSRVADVWFLNGRAYEAISTSRRALVDSLQRIDSLMMKFPLLSRFAMTAVVVCRRP
jgi:2-polyprenyl-3-methyl-5-hydroxy-6-metoxy-1,4-benzoquinol methylase